MHSIIPSDYRAPPIATDSPLGVEPRAAIFDSLSNGNHGAGAGGGDAEAKALLLALELNDEPSIEFFLSTCNRISLTEADTRRLFPKIKLALLLTLQQKFKLADHLIKLISKLNAVEQMELLTIEAISNHYNILMLAAEYQPEALPSILTCIKTFDKGLQKELMGTPNALGYNALMLAVRYQPAAFSHLLARIRTFDLPLQQELLSKKNNLDWDIFMLAVSYQPAALKELLNSIHNIKSLDSKKRILHALLSRKESRGYNALILAAYYSPTALPELLSIIERFTIDSKELFKARGIDDYNALMMAVVNQPSSVPLLLEMISTFPPDLRKEILTTQSTADNRATPLMLAVFHNPTAVPALLAAINTLAPSVQKEILTVRNKTGDAFILAARANNGTLSTLFEFIRTLPLATQKEIILSTLLCSIKPWPTFIPKFLSFIASYEFDTQLSILNATSSLFSEAIQAHKEGLIATRIAVLREGTALQQAIYQELTRIQLYAASKKEAILLALYHLEKNLPPDTPLDTAIHNALGDLTSDLCKALNIKRFSLFSSTTSQTRCLERILAVSRTLLPPATTSIASASATAIP